jgi:hypothetical protein
MPDKSKGRGQMKCSSRSSRLGFGRGANDPNPEKIYFYENMERGQDQHRFVGPVKKKKKEEEEEEEEEK